MFIIILWLIKLYFIMTNILEVSFTRSQRLQTTLSANTETSHQNKQCVPLRQINKCDKIKRLECQFFSYTRKFVCKNKTRDINYLYRNITKKSLVADKFQFQYMLM